MAFQVVCKKSKHEPQFISELIPADSLLLSVSFISVCGIKIIYTHVNRFRIYNKKICAFSWKKCKCMKIRGAKKILQTCKNVFFFFTYLPSSQTPFSIPHSRSLEECEQLNNMSEKVLQI